jgi:hypothetical protein
MALDIDLQLVISHVKSASVGANNINKDFLLPSAEDDFVKRGVNSTSQRCLVVWTTYISPQLMAEFYKGKIGSWYLAPILIPWTLDLRGGVSRVSCLPRTLSQA